MEILEHKTEWAGFLSITEGTEVIVNSIDNDVWVAEYEITGALIGEVES